MMAKSIPPTFKTAWNVVCGAWGGWRGRSDWHAANHAGGKSYTTTLESTTIASIVMARRRAKGKGKDTTKVVQVVARRET